MNFSKLIKNLFNSILIPTEQEKYIDKYGRSFYSHISDQRLTYVDKVMVQAITASNFIKMLKYNYSMFENTTIISAGVKPEILGSHELLHRKTCVFKATQKIVGQLYDVSVMVDSSNFDVSREVKEDVLTIYAVKGESDPLVLASYFWKLNEDKLRQILYIIPGVRDVKFNITEPMLFTCKITNRDCVSYLLLCIFFILDQLDKDYRLKAALNKNKKLYTETFYDMQSEE